MAVQVNRLFEECVDDPSIEALSVLLPEIIDVETLTYFVWSLSKQPGWAIEREHP